jgi:hypothetical protein
MYTSALLTALSLFTLLTPTYAADCVFAIGSIITSPHDHSIPMDGRVMRNSYSNTVCTGKSYLDADAHWALNCTSGYIFAITQDATEFWYQNAENEVYHATDLQTTNQMGVVNYGGWFFDETRCTEA